MTPPGRPAPIGEHTHEGWCARLRPRGVGRFFGAAFLCVWLCGWAVGEVVVLGILAVGAFKLARGEPFRPGGAPPDTAGALFAGGFLLFWVAFWTVGGLAAIRELLRLLWSEHQLVITPGALTVRRRTGFVRRTQEIPRDELRRIYLGTGNAAVMAELSAGPLEITRLGTGAERVALVDELRRQLCLAESAEGAEQPATLPDGWEAIVNPEGGVALVENLAIRHKQARVAWFVAAPLSLGAFYFILQALRRPELWGVAAMAAAAGVGLVWIASTLTWGRTEWRVGSGRIIERRRFRSRVRERFEAVALEITLTKDSDGDPWYALEGLSDPAAPEALPSNRKGRRRIAATLRDKTVPARVGNWLAQHARVPLGDRATDRAQKVEAERLLVELEKSGALGRTVARWVRARARSTTT